MDVIKHCINFVGDEGVLQPIGNTFLFSFLTETIGGKFVSKNSGRIILTNQDLDVQGKFARWVKVTAIGPRVTDFVVGDIVLVEALQWTIEYKFNGQSYWKSDDTKVIAIGANESVAFDY
jgi:exosome complex RNA-binding protein Rrp4